MSSAVTLLASAARTTTGTLDVSIDISKVKAALFMFEVTVADTDAGDLLDVYVQHSPDAGTTYDDFVHFTQVIGTSTGYKELAQWTAFTGLPETEVRAPQDGAVGVGVVQGPVGDDWRIKWDIVDAGAANVSFTFSVIGRLING